VAVGDEDERDEARNARMLRGDTCHHLDETPAQPPATVEDALVCQQCVEAGVHWVSLRRCLTCGDVACCDSSPFRHATEHFHETTHPVMQSAQPGEDWRWCYVHHLTG
jgi:CPA1 family monovalent cation:H+ antiporter